MDGVRFFGTDIGGQDNCQRCLEFLPSLETSKTKTSTSPKNQNQHQNQHQNEHQHENENQNENGP
jgi:hypothetical protein